jgi:hypothetical protein
MTAAQFRRIALSFPEAVEASHMDHPDFRVGGRIFATLAADGSAGVVMLDREDQEFLIRIGEGAFSPAAGAWGQQGSTVITLRNAKPALVRDAIEAAWRRRAPKRLLSQR